MKLFAGLVGIAIIAGTIGLESQTTTATCPAVPPNSIVVIRNNQIQGVFSDLPTADTWVTQQPNPATFQVWVWPITPTNPNPTVAKGTLWTGRHMPGKRLDEERPTLAGGN